MWLHGASVLSDQPKPAGTITNTGFLAFMARTYDQKAGADATFASLLKPILQAAGLTLDPDQEPQKVGDEIIAFAEGEQDYEVHVDTKTGQVSLVPI